MNRSKVLLLSASVLALVIIAALASTLIAKNAGERAYGAFVRNCIYHSGTVMDMPAGEGCYLDDGTLQSVWTP